MPEPLLTIQQLPELDETRAPQVRPWFELRAHTAELRDRADQLSADAQVLHSEVQGADLDRWAMRLAQSDPADLLDVVSGDLGMSWNVLAQVVGVSPTAVRKWRRGQPMTPENRRRLALVVAFCEALREINPRITDASLWLETPLHAATTLTGADLLAAGHAEGLLDVAAERISPATALAEFDQAWRETYPADYRFRVVDASDGLPSIVPADGE